MLLSAARGAFPVALPQLAPRPGWVSYVHPALPDIRFVYPADWSASTLRTMQSLGVRLLAPDDLGVWESNYVQLHGQVVTAAQAAQYGVASLLGDGSSARVLCAVDLGAAGAIRGAFLAVADESRIAAAEGLVAYDQTSGLPMLAIYHAVSSPARRFSEATEQVYLSLFAQLLPGNPNRFRKNGEGGDDSDEKDTGKDSDGDGVPDRKDSHPSDPSRS